jgi:hypothetical protein
MENSSIGLVAWGLKLGKQVFFHSPNIRIDSPSISVALEDIRGVVNFSSPNLTFYSLERIESYRVYTIYNSVYDWVNRDGAYFAFSVFIPHGLLTKNHGQLLDLLQQLAQTYRTLYVEHDSNQIKKGQENTGLFFDMVQKLACTPQRIQSNGSAGTNKRFAHIPFAADSEMLSSYFEDPYRTEFKPFKQVFFLDQSLLNSGRLRMSASSTSLTVAPLADRYTVKLNFGNDPSQTAADLERLEVYINGCSEGKSTLLYNLQKDDVLIIKAGREHFETFDKTFSLAEWIRGGPKTTIDFPIILEPIKYKLHISVTDGYNKKISGVKLLIPEIGWLVTNKNGEFTTQPQFVHNAKIQITANAKGYQDQIKEHPLEYHRNGDLLVTTIKMQQRSNGSSGNTDYLIPL